jgi:hypothetical protein
MPRVDAILYKSPAEGQTGVREFRDLSDCNVFVVSKGTHYSGQDYIKVFFPNTLHPNTGVALELPPNEVAAVAHALLSMEDGGLSKIEGTFEVNQLNPQG